MIWRDSNISSIQHFFEIIPAAVTRSERFIFFLNVEYLNKMTTSVSLSKRLSEHFSDYFYCGETFASSFYLFLITWSACSMWRNKVTTQLNESDGSQCKFCLRWWPQRSMGKHPSKQSNLILKKNVCDCINLFSFFLEIIIKENAQDCEKESVKWRRVFSTIPRRLFLLSKPDRFTVLYLR